MTKIYFIRLVLLIFSLNSVGYSSCLDAISFDGDSNIKSELSAHLGARNIELESATIGTDGRIHKLVISRDILEHVLFGSLLQLSTSKALALGSNLLKNDLEVGQILQWPKSGGHYYPVMECLQRYGILRFNSLHVHRENALALCQIKSSDTIIRRETGNGGIEDKYNAAIGGIKGLDLAGVEGERPERLHQKLHTLFPRSMGIDDIVDAIFASFESALKGNPNTSINLTGRNLKFSAVLKEGASDEFPVTGFFAVLTQAEFHTIYRLRSFHPAPEIDQEPVFQSLTWLQAGDSSLQIACLAHRPSSPLATHSGEVEQEPLSREVLNGIPSKLRGGEALIAFLRSHKDTVLPFSLKHILCEVWMHQHPWEVLDGGAETLSSLVTCFESVRANGGQSDTQLRFEERLGSLLNRETGSSELVLAMVAAALERQPLASGRAVTFGFGLLIELDRPLATAKVGSNAAPFTCYASVVAKRKDRAGALCIEGARIFALDFGAAAVRADEDANGTLIEDMELSVRILGQVTFTSRKY